MTSVCFGNRCGHDPAKPLLDLPASINKRLPKLLQDTIKKVKHFYANPSDFTFLNHEERQRRSESREAMVQVLSVLFLHLDLVTMKLVRVDKKGNKHNVSIAYLHSQTGLSFSRFKRAWLALIDSGIAKSFKQYDHKKDHGIYKGLPSIKTITPLLFTALNLNKRLKASRDYASERQRKSQGRKTTAIKAAETLIDHANSQRVKKVMSKALKQMLGGKQPQKPKAKPNNHINNKLANAGWNK